MKDIHESIIQKYVKDVGLSRATTDSFDDFVNRRIREIISLMRPIHANCFMPDGTERIIDFIITGGTLESPVMLENDGTSRPIYPSECRIRHLTYGSPLYVDIHVKRNNGKDSLLKDVYVGRIPIMVYSSICYLNNPKQRVKHGECPRDPGGYFIVNGNEKSLVGQKTATHNRMITYARNNSYAIAVKSELNSRVYVTTIKYKKNASLMCTFPRLQTEVPLMNVLIAMGATKDNIKKVFSVAELALMSASFKNLPSDQVEARRRLSVREVYNVCASDDERLDDAFKKVMIPHIDVEDGYEKKICFLLSMVKELLGVALGTLQPTDRDSVINQRVEMSYTLLSTLFHHLMIKMQNDIRLVTQKSLAKLKRGITDEKVRHWFSSNTSITDGIQYALATGNWNTTFVNRTQRVGVAQALQRLSYMATVSQLRRISSSVDAGQKLAKPRYLHGTHWGRYCPSETPEGAPCGLETQLSIQAYVSLETSPDIIISVIKQYLNAISIDSLNIGTQVYVNGIYLGNTTSVVRLINSVRKLRRTGQASKDISVSLCLLRNVIHISTTAGRLCRPLLIVKSNKLLYKSKHEDLSWSEMLTRGLIEYLDCEEEDTMMVAFDPSYLQSSANGLTKVKYTHCEISCTLIHGLNAASIPFSDHNPASRNTFQCAMGKQPQGVFATNYQTRYDTTSNILQYGQKPLVSTRLADLYGVHECPAGQNAIVAVMPWEGFGQEDSIVVNQSALDRGFARSDRYKTIKDSVSSKKDQSAFAKPLKPKKFGKYNKLDPNDGLIHPKEEINHRDCIIGKQTVRSNDVTNAVVYEDQSTLSDLTGRIDKVMMYQQRNGDRAVKIRVRTQRIPVVGDKFSSRHGQKGTIGMTYTQEDLPYTIDGIVPDIILNPHALPSRMTIAHLIETLAAKGASLSGKLVDASPFSGQKIEDLEQTLKDYGFQSHGNEQMYSPFTGEPIKAKIFMGPIFYQRLKHMVDEKIHSRGRGRRNALTGQPNEGRANGGGLRVGEMEKDSMNAHGVPYVINERMCISSDAHTITICKKCQSKLVILNGICKVCNTPGTNIQIPSAANLLIQELQSMCINVKLKSAD